MSLTAADQSMVVERPRGRSHDYWFLASAAGLIGVGLFSLASLDAGQDTSFFTRQLIFAALGLVVFLFFNRIRLETFRVLATPLYIINILLLAATLVVGRGRGVTQRALDLGFMQFQPSELTKILLALTLAAYFANREDRIKELGTWLGALGHIAPILALVYLQPHMGATLSLLFMAIMGAIHIGVPWKYFPATLLGIVVLGGLLFTFKLIPEYQLKRFETKLSAVKTGKKDIRGDDYQIHQGTLAIGSGGVTGAGFFQGDQKESGVIPEQQNDLIFTVIGEEGGLVGSSLVLCLFAFFFYRVWLRVWQAKTVMGIVTGSCLFAVIAFHFLVNMSMVLGMGLVIGLWLPFMSAGGTALWMCMAAVGLLDQCE